MDHVKSICKRAWGIHITIPLLRLIVTTLASRNTAQTTRHTDQAHRNHTCLGCKVLVAVGFPKPPSYAGFPRAFGDGLLVYPVAFCGVNRNVCHPRKSLGRISMHAHSE